MNGMGVTHIFSQAQSDAALINRMGVTHLFFQAQSDAARAGVIKFMGGVDAVGQRFAETQARLKWMRALLLRVDIEEKGVVNVPALTKARILCYIYSL